MSFPFPMQVLRTGDQRLTHMSFPQKTHFLHRLLIHHDPVTGFSYFWFKNTLTSHIFAFCSQRWEPAIRNAFWITVLLEYYDDSGHLVCQTCCQEASQSSASLNSEKGTELSFFTNVSTLHANMASGSAAPAI